MKFAKHLRESQHAEWDDAYVDYKLLKKILKQLQTPCAAESFCRHLENQINKVAKFMREQQDYIADGVIPLCDIGPRSSAASSQVESASAVRPHSDERQLSLVCEDVVVNVQKFHSFTEINQEALRKIIKKFEKRFQLSFHEQVYPLAAPAMPCTQKDIAAWLLRPASRCLHLVRDLACLEVAKPIQQFNFWATELAIGCDLLRHRLDDLDETSDAYKLSSVCLRLRTLGPDKLRMCIKNTFIHEADDGKEREPSQGGARGSRRRSLPPSFSTSVVQVGRERQGTITSSEDLSSNSMEEEYETDAEEWSRTPVVVLEHIMCEQLQVSPPPRDWSCMEEIAIEEELLSRDEALMGNSWSLATPSSDHSKGDGWVEAPSRERTTKKQKGGSYSSSDGGSGAGKSSRRAGRTRGRATDTTSAVSGTSEQQRGQRQNSGSATSTYWRDSASSREDSSEASGVLAAAAPADRSCYSPSLRADANLNLHALQGSQGHQSEGHGARWWTESPGECPLCGFPVSLLPHPPFRFRAEPNSSGRYRLVDGQYLALEVLSTWRFEALGRQLTMKDITALDAYMKRCKLGPWRLGEAMALLADASSEAHAKLETLRRSARRKLEDLRRIQQRRKQLASAAAQPVR